MVLCDRLGQRTAPLALIKQVLSNRKRRKNLPSLERNRVDSYPAFRLVSSLTLHRQVSSHQGARTLSPVPSTAEQCLVPDCKLGQSTPYP